jgi:hypothetical protein
MMPVAPRAFSAKAMAQLSRPIGMPAMRAPSSTEPSLLRQATVTTRVTSIGSKLVTKLVFMPIETK